MWNELIAPILLLFMGLFSYCHSVRHKERALARNENPLKGVSGWLLFFVLFRGFCLAFLFIVSLGNILSLDALPFEMVPGLKIYNLCILGVSTAYVYGLSLLWRVRKNALSWITFLLLATPFFVFLDPLFSYLAKTALPLPSHRETLHTAPMYTSSKVTGALLASLESMGWLAYFSVSERVKNTWQIPRARQGA